MQSQLIGKRVIVRGLTEETLGYCKEVVSYEFVKWLFGRNKKNRPFYAVIIHDVNSSGYMELETEEKVNGRGLRFPVGVVGVSRPNRIHDDVYVIDEAGIETGLAYLYTKEKLGDKDAALHN